MEHFLEDHLTLSFRASTAFRLPMIGKNSTRAVCAMLLIPHKFLVEFLQSGSEESASVRGKADSSSLRSSAETHLLTPGAGMSCILSSAACFFSDLIWVSRYLRS